MKNLPAFLAAMSSEDTDNRGLTHEQQITRLQEFFAQVYAVEPERFEPGQIVWHKNPAASDFKDADVPYMFIEYLKEPVSGLDYIHEPMEFGSAPTAMVRDCRIANLIGEKFAVYLQDSRVFTSVAPKVSE